LDFLFIVENLERPLDGWNCSRSNSNRKQLTAIASVLRRIAVRRADFPCAR
jgi:hypothetical protein